MQTKSMFSRVFSDGLRSTQFDAGPSVLFDGISAHSLAYCCVVIIIVKTRISTRVLLLYVALSNLGLINMYMFGCGMDRERDGRTACTAVAKTIN